MLSLAEQLIFERYKQPEFGGLIQPADLTTDGSNQSCGDEVHLTAKLAGELLLELKHQTRACAVCSASADLLCEYMLGKQVKDLPTEDQVISWLDIPLSPVRRKCAILPLETLKIGLDLKLNQSEPAVG